MDDYTNLEALNVLISQKLDEQIDRDNPDELTGKLMELCSLQATATHAYALAERLYNIKIASLAILDEYKKMTATDKKMIFAGLANKEIQSLTISERHIKNLSYSIEGIRSALSWKKSELENSRYQNT